MTTEVLDYKLISKVNKKIKGKLHDRPDIDMPPEPAPTPMPIAGREEDEAKKKARKRMGRGRESTRLAGRMMASNNAILKTKLG